MTLMQLPQSKTYSSLPLTAASKTKLPFYHCKVIAGFPSPADDYLDKHLSLDDLLIKRPEATFFVRAVGDSMNNAGIYSDDILIVDKSITARDGHIVIAAINGEMTVKRLRLKGTEVHLRAENPAYPILIITEAHDLVILGVVTNVIHSTLPH